MLFNVFIEYVLEGVGDDIDKICGIPRLGRRGSKCLSTV